MPSSNKAGVASPKGLSKGGSPRANGQLAGVGKSQPAGTLNRLGNAKGAVRVNSTQASPRPLPVPQEADRYRAPHGGSGRVGMNFRPTKSGKVCG